MPHECTNCGRTFPDGSKEMLSGCPDCGGNKFQFAPAAQAGAGSESTSATSTDAADDPRGDATGSSGTVERAAETVRDWVSADADRSGDPPADTGSGAGSNPGTDTHGTDDEPSNRPWPASDDAADDGAASTDTGEFDEWPETARRPEDRSTPPSDASATPSTDSRSSPTDRADRTDEREARSADDRSIMADSENTAQSDARSEVVSTDDLPDGTVRGGRDDVTAGDGTPGDAAVRDGTRGPNPVDGDGDDEPPADGRVVSEPSGEQPSIEELREELNEQFESIKIVSPGQYELNLMELYNREEYIISLQEDGRYVIDVPDSWRSDDE